LKGQGHIAANDRPDAFGRTWLEVSTMTSRALPEARTSALRTAGRCLVGLSLAFGACTDTGETPMSPATEPAAVAAPAAALSFKIVGTGDFFGCGITTDNRAFCWGDNEDGQLGDGTRIDHSRPAEVKRGLRFMDLSAGSSHACAGGTDSLVYCWGLNSYGQLGDGTLGHRLTPAKVGIRHYKQVSAGALHTCAVTAANRVYCWGFNAQGQLGDGSTVNRLLPVPVKGGVRFRQIGAGGSHTCGITPADKAYCWGFNGNHELGDGSGAAQRTVPTAVATALTFRHISAGGTQSCAIAPDRQGYCWGLNDAGQVGNGDVNPVATPTLVTGGHSFNTLTAGGDFTCGVTTGHEAYCWGNNFASKLGDGTSVNARLIPTAVVGGLSFSGVDPGTQSTCGVTTGKLAYCWGHNGKGQLGDGRTDGPNLCFGIPCAKQPEAVVGPS
jgi:alpha-tubulin suppressor-like RCC1 family protein